MNILDESIKRQISAMGSGYARYYQQNTKNAKYPVDPEIIAGKLFGVYVSAVPGIHRGLRVRSGIDTTGKELFIDEDLLMDDNAQPYARQSIAHELGHIIFDSDILSAINTSSPEEAFEVHMALSESSLLERRAHYFAESLLVPRRDFLIEVSKILAKNLPDLKLSNPDMQVDTLIAALAGSKLANYFGVSDDVIRWRLINENFYQLLHLRPEMKLSEVDVTAVLELCGTEAERPEQPISKKILDQVPENIKVHFGALFSSEAS
jgi:Zn-dependent peptidase ImmA (M78 family)